MPAYGVASGQAAVLYEGDVVVGAGTIVSRPDRNLTRPLARCTTAGRMTGDEITLDDSRDAPFHEVAHLVLGGRRRTPQPQLRGLDDLQLALDAVLERARRTAR